MMNELRLLALLALTLVTACAPHPGVTIPTRGRILASDGTVLAETVIEWTIHIDPQSTLADRKKWPDERLIETLSEKLDIERSHIERALAHTKKRYIHIATIRDSKLAEELRANRKNWRLIITKQQARSYPLGPAAAHYVGVAHYRPGLGALYTERVDKNGITEFVHFNTRGTMGAEYKYDRRLRWGNDVTIDLVPEVQTNLYASISNGWAIVRDGSKVVAFAKKPSFDPEHYWRYGPEHWGMPDEGEIGSLEFLRPDPEDRY